MSRVVLDLETLGFLARPHQGENPNGEKPTSICEIAAIDISILAAACDLVRGDSTVNISSLDPSWSILSLDPYASHSRWRDNPIFLDSPLCYAGDCRPWEGAQITPLSLDFLQLSSETLFSRPRTHHDLIGGFYRWFRDGCEIESLYREGRNDISPRFLSCIRDYRRRFGPQREIFGYNIRFDFEHGSAALERANIDGTIPFEMHDQHTLFVDRLESFGEIKKTPEGKASLTEALEFVGLPDEPMPHLAIVGAMLESELQWRLCGQTLLPQLEKYPLPPRLSIYASIRRDRRY